MWLDKAKQVKEVVWQEPAVRSRCTVQPPVESDSGAQVALILNAIL